MRRGARAPSPFVLRLSKPVLSAVEGGGRRFGAHEGSWFESLTTNGTGAGVSDRTRLRVTRMEE